MRDGTLTRRELVQLAVAVAGGLLLWRLFLALQPIGDDVGRLATVAAIRDDRESPATGSPAATATIILFTDYQCPACRSSEAALQAAARRDGKVRIVYKEWPVFGPRSERAARVALASARQGIYPAVHSALMQAPRMDETALREAVERSGGDWSRLEVDLRGLQAAIEAELARTRTQAFALGLEGTPSYLIGPILVRGALDQRGFARAIAAARAADRKQGRPPR